MRLFQFLVPGDDQPFWVRSIPAIITNTIALVAVYTFICYSSSTGIQSHWREIVYTAMVMYPSGILGSETWHRWNRAKQSEML